MASILAMPFCVFMRLCSLKLSLFIFATPIIRGFAGFVNLLSKKPASFLSPKSCSFSFLANCLSCAFVAISKALFRLSRPKIVSLCVTSSAPTLRASCFRIFAAGVFISSIKIKFISLFSCMSFAPAGLGETALQISSKSLLLFIL